MDDWVIDNHAVDRWRERIHPDGDAESVRVRIAGARRPSRKQRRKLRDYWEAHGKGGVSREINPKAPQYILVTRSVCFVVWAPNVVKTVYQMPR